MSLFKKLGFFGSFAAAETEKGVDALMRVLVNFDPATATAVEIEQISKVLSDFCVKTEEARQAMQKEAADVVRVKADYAKKMQLAEIWQTELDDPATTPERKTQIEAGLAKLIDELEEFVPRIAQEEEEAQIAKETFETLDEVVKITNEKLRTKVKQKDSAIAGLKLAQAKENLANQKVDAAKVLSGIKTASNSFSASDVIKEQTNGIMNRTAGKLREAELLKGYKEGDDFVAKELAKIDGTDKSQTSLKDRLAALKK